MQVLHASLYDGANADQRRNAKVLIMNRLQKYAIVRMLLLSVVVVLSLPSAGQAFDTNPDVATPPDGVVDSRPDGEFAPFDPNSAFDMPKVQYEIKLSADGVKPGGQITLAVIADILNGWHIQTSEDRIIGKDFKPIPYEIDLSKAPLGLRFGDIQWPEEHPAMVDVGEGPIEAMFYEGIAPTFIKITVPQSAEVGKMTFQITTTHQACDDKGCLPPTDMVHEVTLNIVGNDAVVTPQHETLFAQYSGVGNAAIQFDLFGLSFSVVESSLFLILVVAAIGGFLLNLTPCVLPMVPIKIMGFSKASDGSRAKCFGLGVVMCLGVVAFWLGLGLAIATISGFTATNSLFQQPWFPICVGVIIAIMAIGMCGMFTIQLPQAAYKVNPSQDTVHGSFLFGIMTAVLSTPCTAPFMGSAAAWAATQSMAITLLVFAAIGVGMALPYFILAAYPKLVSKVPRTGPASELIKQVMGLFMLAAAAYFIGAGMSGLLVSPPDPPPLFYWWFVGLFIAIAGGWLAYRSVKIAVSPVRDVVFSGLGVVLVVVGLYGGYRMTDPGPIDWVYYTPERLEEATQRGDIVVIDFTAEWCINCKTMERNVLYTEAVSEKLNSDGITPIKIDLTGNNIVGNEKLTELGRRSIPLLVVLDGNGKEVFKGDFYTQQQVLDAIEKAKGSTASKAKTKPIPPTTPTSN